MMPSPHLLPWSENRQLLYKIIERKNSELTEAILGCYEPEIVEGHNLSWQWVENLLEWFAEADASDHWAALRFSEFVMGNASDLCKEKIVALAADPDFPYHDLLARRLIPPKGY